MRTQEPLYNTRGKLIGHLVTTYTPVSPPLVVAQTRRQACPAAPARNGYQQLIEIAEAYCAEWQRRRETAAEAMPPPAPRTLELVVERQRALGLRP